MTDFLELDVLIQKCLEINKKTNDNIKCMNIMTDKDKDELDKISLKYFKDNLVKIHRLEFDKELSFLNAFCYSLISKYKLLNNEQQKEYLEKNFITQILRDLRKKNGINKYITPTCALDKSIITTGFKQKKLNDNHIKFLSIFFNINIFIIKENVNTAKTDTQEPYITILYTRNKTFNIFKHSIILFLDKNNLYYPLSINNHFIFIYTKDDIFKKFIDNNLIFIEQTKDNDIIYETLSKLYDYDIENIEENKNNLLKDKNKDKSNDDTITSISSSTNINSISSKEQSIINKNNNLENNKLENNDKIKTDNINKDIENKLDNVIDDKDDKEEDKDNNSIEEFKKDNINPNINDLNIVSKTPDTSKDNNETEENTNTITITTEQAIMNVLEPQKIQKYTKDELEQLPVVELKKLLKENKIKQSIKVDGKIKQKTRKEIINDLLNILE